VGKTWSRTVQVYSLPDTVDNGSVEIAFEVYEEGVVATPAGDFPSFGIGQALPVLAFLPEGYSLIGTAVAAGRAEATEWWSAGVGEVQYQSSDLYRLSSWGGATSTAEANWGDVKRLFR
jgi:hypothetical protein